MTDLAIHSSSGSDDLEATVDLIRGAISGDASARNRLFARMRPALTRWVHGRLPAYARGEFSSSDIVQNTLCKAFERLDRFESKAPGSFFAYLRTIASNQITDAIRKAKRRPSTELNEALADPKVGPLEEAVGKQQSERIENARLRLPDRYQAVIFLRIELDYSFEEIAKALEVPTANAARQLYIRAIARLARELHVGRKS